MSQRKFVPLILNEEQRTRIKRIVPQDPAIAEHFSKLETQPDFKGNYVGLSWWPSPNRSEESVGTGLSPRRADFIFDYTYTANQLRDLGAETVAEVEYVDPSTLIMIVSFYEIPYSYKVNREDIWGFKNAKQCIRKHFTLLEVHNKDEFEKFSHLDMDDRVANWLRRVLYKKEDPQ